MQKTNYNFWKSFRESCKRVWKAMKEELQMILNDWGFIIVFFGATLFYPLLYPMIYRNETIRNMPVAIVDESQTFLSRDLTRRIDASPDLEVVASFPNLEEAAKAFRRQNVHGVIYIEKDYEKKINRNEQAFVSIYCDMSSFLYYRAMMLGANFAILDAGNDIKLQRLNQLGVTGKTAEIVASPFEHEANILYNKPMGFASFLLPAILILIIHQTLFFGLTIVNGSACEEGRLYNDIFAHLNGSTYEKLLGKVLFYFLFYITVVCYILLIIPKIFNLPHIGKSIDVILFMIPFLLAAIFFSLTIASFIKNRETGLVVFLFSTVVLLFLSGFSWPMSNISRFWRTFGMLFPTTYGIQGYIKINSMSADLSQVKFEYIALWIQVIVYSLTAVVFRRFNYERYAKTNKSASNVIVEM